MTQKLVLLIFSISILFSESIKENYTDISLRIISEALSDSTAFNRLAYLCDMFGPRLSGSKNLENSINKGNPTYPKPIIETFFLLFIIYSFYIMIKYKFFIKFI